MIARAAHEIGLDDITMREVAERLGVSVPGLYHHVDGKDDLLRMAAEYSAGLIELPKDRGQHWAVWLLEWGFYNHDAFMAQPELLKQFIEGAISIDRTATGLESALSILVRAGFSPTEARLAYAAVSEYAVGAAVMGLREQRATEQGKPTIAEIHRVLAQSDAAEYPQLRALVTDGAANLRDGFEEGLMFLLRGICEERGESWSMIRPKIRRAMKKA